MAAVLNLTGTMFIQGTLHETRADLCSLFEHSHAAAVLMNLAVMMGRPPSRCSCWTDDEGAAELFIPI